VAWIVEELIPTAQIILKKTLDSDKAIAIALVHDDAEILFGDIQAGNKAKMKDTELKQVEQLERDAIECLSIRYPSYLGKYDYKLLLLDVLSKTSLESMLVSWADKYDAFCEALHELYAGHTLWISNVENEYGKIQLPTEYYMNYFSSFQQKFPISTDLFLQSNSWWKIPDEPKIFDIVAQGQEHTEQSLKIPKNYIPYDQWIDLALKKGTTEDIINLYLKKEK